MAKKQVMVLLNKQNQNKKNWIMQTFSLRLYQNDGDTHVNKQIGTFTRQEQNKSVHVYRDALPDDVDWSNCSLQIYPANPSKKSFYALDPNQVMYVYYTDAENGTNVKIGRETRPDSYLYFKPPPKVAISRIVVVVAPIVMTDEEVIKLIV